MRTPSKDQPLHCNAFAKPPFLKHLRFGDAQAKRCRTVRLATRGRSQCSSGTRPRRFGRRSWRALSQGLPPIKEAQTPYPDSSPHEGQFAEFPSTSRWHVHSLGKRYTGAMYTDTSGACTEAAPRENNGYFEIEPELPPTDFAEVKLIRPQ